MHNPIKSRRCFCCGSRYRLADHHLQPRESGGLNEVRNLITLCATCHDAVEGRQEGLSSEDIWQNILKRRAAFERESSGRKRYRLSRENAQPCPAYVSFDEKQRLAIESRKATLNAMSIHEYFEQSDTPAENSPMGVVMVRLLAKDPGMNLEQAHAKANELLKQAAGKRFYRVPPVLTEEEQEARRRALRAHFRSEDGPGCSPECQETPVSSVTPPKTVRDGVCPIRLR